MKTNFLKIAALILMAALPFSCGVREEEPEAFTGKIAFTATGANAKTAFADAEGGIYPCLWTGNNECIALSLNWAEKQVAAITASEDGRSASFELEFEAPEAPSFAFAAFSPASAVIAASSSRQAWSIALPVDQRPLPNSPDESAQLLSAVSGPFSAMPTKVSLGFSHVSAYGRLAISGLQNGEAAIRGIELTSSVPLAGNWYFSPEDGSLTDNGASSSLYLETDRVDDVWFACMPCEMGGQTLSISVLTEEGRFTKTIRPREGLAFLPGKVARISVDFSGIQVESSAEVFSLVTDVTSLAVGDEILIVNTAGDRALSSQYSNQYRNEAAVSSVNGTIEDPGEATVLQLAAGKANGTWAMKDGNAYLASTSNTKKNYLATQSSLDNYASWAISIASDGKATLTAQAGSSTIIRHNKQNTRFSCYKPANISSNGTYDICIYKKGGSSTPVDDDPMLAFTQYGLNLGGMQRFYSPGTDQYQRRYDEEGAHAFVILEPEGKEQLEITGYDPSLRQGEQAVFTVTWRKGLSSKLSGTWTLTLVREEGPKVWLSDGKGGGVILKK